MRLSGLAAILTIGFIAGPLMADAQQAGKMWLGLMSYGPSIVEMCRGMASYVDRILKGAKPGDRPIERPQTFELVVSLKTAKALGLMIE